MDSGVGGNRSAVNTTLIWRGLLLTPVIFLLVFYFYPLARILYISFIPDWSGIQRLWQDVYYRELLGFTFFQAAVSTLATLLLAVPSAYVFVRYDFRGKSFLLALSALAFVLPTIVVAAAFRSLIGPNGLVNNLLVSLLGLAEPPIQLERTFAIIIIVHIFYNYAVALRIITGYWANRGTHIEEAARVLGTGGWRLWLQIRLPLLRPAILTAAALIFIFTFTSFGVVLILGGLRFATLEVEIYRQTVNFGNLPLAAALSMIQLVVMFCFLLIYTRMQPQTAVQWQRVQPRRPASWQQKMLVYGVVGFMLVFLFMPLLSLVISSVIGENGFTTLYYQSLSTNDRSSILFVPPTQAIGNSFVFAVATTILSMVLGIIAAYLLARRRAGWLDAVFMLPLATSAVTLGFGFIIALDRPPLNLRSSPVLIPIAHSLVAMPFVVRSILPALQGIQTSIHDAARVLGAGDWRRWWRIDLPLIHRSLIVAATFAFTISMGEFGASLFVARPDTPTMPVVIYRFLGQPGGRNYGQALAMSVLLMLVCGISFLLIERVRDNSSGGDF